MYGVARPTRPGGDVQLNLDGYRTTRLLRAAGSTRVFAAVRESDQRPVVAKVYDLDADEGLEARVQHEFRLIHGLEVEGVVRALALERAGRQLVLVLEWCEGVNLEEFCAGQPLPVLDFLDIAIQVTTVLAAVHAERVIHRDIKPTNLLIDPDTRRVALADFGISVLLESERERIYDPAVVEGTLPYVSPEQTGRTGREVDFRSDLYSLGVTFYELLTGRRPFASETPLELIHAHLARRPEPPQWLRPELPSPLSALVMKLLEKAPERRYQSARGLHDDLVRLRELVRSGGPLDAFVLGRSDVPSSLQLPHRLYGRARETELLLREFRKAAQGSARMVVLLGPAGIGKTALLDQLVEPVLGRRGYLARGRFERGGSDQPYAAIVVALSELADQLLTESDERLARWRALLHEQLGGLAQVICELVPKFRPVLGESQSSHEIGLIEGRHRVALACVRLFAAIARPDHPLVLAIDELAWADPASCELLEIVLLEHELALLVVGTLREVEAGLPVAELLARLREHELPVESIVLGPLSVHDLALLTADATGRAPAQVDSLVELLRRRTGGSPMLVRQLLVHLADLGLLRPTSEGWSWDAAAIEAAGIPEDSLEMMTAKIARLDQGSRELLTIASVIGTRFEAQMLEELAGVQAVTLGLHRLLDEGLILVSGTHDYVFGHARIREAAYASLDDELKRHLHVAVGQLRLARLGPAELSEGVFEVVDHLDRGYGLVSLDHAGLLDAHIDVWERTAPDRAAARERVRGAMETLGSLAHELAELNALAGHKALGTASYALAEQYLEVGVTLLEQLGEFPRPGEPGHTLAFALELGLAQAQMLAGDRQGGDSRFEALRVRELAPLERAQVVTKHYELLALLGEPQRALALGLRELASMGVVLPRSPSKLEVTAALLRLATTLGRVDVETLQERPWAKDLHVRASFELLGALVSNTYAVDGGLFVIVVERMVGLFLTHGRHPMVPVALTQAGLLMANGLELRGLGDRLVDLAAAMAEREGQSCPRHKIGLSVAFHRGWTDTLRQALVRIRRATAQALEVGDLECAGSGLSMQAALELLSGTHLRVVEQHVQAAMRRTLRLQASDAIAGLTVIERFCALLARGELPAPGDCDPLDLGSLPAGTEAGRHHTRMFTALALLAFGRYRELVELLDQHADAIARGMLGSWHVPMVLVVHGMALAAEAPRMGPLERRAAIARIRRNEQQLRRWVKRGSQGFDYQAELLAAELAALEGDLRGALDRLSRARRGAVAQRCALFEAIAFERMAELCRTSGLEDLAGGPLQQARARWNHWGAFSKVVALERQWPQLRERSVGGGREHVQDTTGGTGGTSSSTSSRALDTATILKTSLAIAEDIRLEEVVDRVLAIALENAGAERGSLLLPTAERGRVAGAGGSAVGIAAVCMADGSPQSFLHQPLPLEQAGDRIPASLVHWVERTREPVVIDDATLDLRFAADPYIRAGRVRSILCAPIVKHSRLVGLLYLENRLSPGSFTDERLEVLRLLMAQAASALENAQLYEALRVSEVRWRSLVEGLPDVIALVDRHGRIEFINHLDENFARSHAVGESGLQLITPPHQEAMTRALAQVVRSGEQLELEAEAQLPGSDSRWYAIRLAPIVVDGRVERVIAVATDVTDRRRAEEERQRFEAQLRQQQRLESIGTLASGVAHEINNPVQGIMNYAELISSSRGVSDEVREFAEEIEHESQRVATIVRNLLAFSRQEGERGTSKVTVDKIVEGTLSLIRTVLRKDQISLSVSLPSDLPEIVCRPQQIQQVLMNLVTNARDAVNLRFPEFDERKGIEIGAQVLEREGRTWVSVYVSDEGGGVPELVVPRIFDPFFTTKGRDQGTGLGLAVSHGIVREHGGELRLDNRPGEGARFVVELPVDGSGIEANRRMRAREHRNTGGLAGPLEAVPQLGVASVRPLGIEKAE